MQTVSTVFYWTATYWHSLWAFLPEHLSPKIVCSQEQFPLGLLYPTFISQYFAPYDLSPLGLLPFRTVAFF